MSQFTAYLNSNEATRARYPLLLEIQSNLLRDLRTTVVIPLAPSEQVGSAAITRLCPVLEINGRSYVAMTQQLAGVDRKLLGDRVADLSAFRADIVAAMDFIICGI
jgi:toxin CcdB